jgi:uncharacterized small protein (DUF1192 family)
MNVIEQLATYSEAQERIPALEAEIEKIDRKLAREAAQRAEGDKR